MTSSVIVGVDRRRFLDHTSALDSIAIDNAYAQWGGVPPAATVVLDLTKATYLPHSTLMYLGALFRHRALRGRLTQLRLAQDPRLIAFLRSWNFPEFLADVTRLPFAALLEPETRHYYANAEIDVPVDVEFTWDPVRREFTDLLPRKHFALTPVDLHISPIRAAMSAHESWREQNILHVLDRHLRNGGRRVATHIVLEAVLNAARHPGALMAYTSSRIFHRSDGSPHELEWCVWDDGQPIASTLLHQTRRGLPIRSGAFGAVDEEFLVQLRGATDRGKEIRILGNTSETPNDHRLMTVLAFLLGVTSTPGRGEEESTGARLETLESEGEHLQAEPYGLDAATSRKAGLGLYLIRRTVIDQFGGSIEYATSHYRYTITKGPESSIYYVSARLKSRAAWPLKGNLFTFHIPLNEEGMANG